MICDFGFTIYDLIRNSTLARKSYIENNEMVV